MCAHESLASDLRGVVEELKALAEALSDGIKANGQKEFSRIHVSGLESRESGIARWFEAVLAKQLSNKGITVRDGAPHQIAVELRDVIDSSSKRLAVQITATLTDAKERVAFRTSRGLVAETAVAAMTGLTVALPLGGAEARTAKMLDAADHPAADFKDNVIRAPGSSSYGVAILDETVDANARRPSVAKTRRAEFLLSFATKSARSRVMNDSRQGAVVLVIGCGVLDKEVQPTVIYIPPESSVICPIELPVSGGKATGDEQQRVSVRFCFAGTFKSFDDLPDELPRFWRGPDIWRITALEASTYNASAIPRWKTNSEISGGPFRTCITVDLRSSQQE